MDIVRLYEDYSVDFVTEGHKHSQEGWVNVECPWCEGNPGYHLGWNIDGNFFHCWRCGSKPIIKTLVKVLRLKEQDVRRIVRTYGVITSTSTPKVKARTKAFQLPSGLTPLLPHHKTYLEHRRFDPERIVKTWGVLSTGPVSLLDNISFSHRLFIPIFWQGEMVSFTSRDVTNKNGLRYLSCPLSRELIPHKEILYGKQEKWKESCILVEGPTDVWRMGTSSVAVSGIKYTPQQVREIARRFKRMAVCFDDDPQARLQAAKIVAELKFRGVDAFRVDIVGDPGAMDQSEADYLVKQLIK